MQSDDEDVHSQQDRLQVYKQVVSSYTGTLNQLLYAYGDDENPQADTAAVLADCVLEFMAEVCTLPPRPRPTPPAYHPIPSKRIPFPSIPALRRTLSRNRHHARKYALLQEHMLALKQKKALEAAKAAAKAAAGGKGAAGAGAGLDMGEDLASLVKLGE